MAHPNEQLIRKTADALSKGDLETFFGAHAEDVVVHIPGTAPGSGDHKSRAAFQDAFGKLNAILDEPPGWTTHDVLANDQHAVVIGEQTFVRGGQTLKAQVTAITHVKNGAFKEVWVCPLNQRELDTFLS